jgi:glucan biosynthesis protein C
MWWYKDDVTNPLADEMLLFLHTFRLPVFFVMAGFFGALLYTKRGSTGLVRNRAQRILLPLLGFVVVLYPILKAGWFYGTIWHKPGAAAATLSFIIENRYWNSIEPGHLWFLEYLLIAYFLALVAIPLSRRLVGPGTEAWFRAAVTSRWRAALFAIPTFATLAAMDWGVLDSPHAFVPVPRIVAAYAVFFFFGWALYFHRDLIPTFATGAWTATLAAVVLGVVNFTLARRQFNPKPHFEALGFYGTAATGALIAWLMIFGATGLFVRYLDRPSACMRYLADSAYWQYLVHAPVVLVAQLVFRGSTMNWALKSLIVTGVSVPVLLLSYEMLVRRTWLGVMLNGRRYLGGTEIPVRGEASVT